MVTMSRGIYERFNGATETSDEEDKKLITFDGNYIQVFYEKDPMVIGWNNRRRPHSNLLGEKHGDDVERDLRAVQRCHRNV